MTFKLFKPRGVFCRCTILIALLMAVGFFSAGCSIVSSVGKKTGKIVRSVTASQGHVSPKIGIALFEDDAGGAARDYGVMIQTGLVTAMEAECPKLRLVREGQEGYPVERSVMGQGADGLGDIPAVISRGRKLGFDAIVSGHLLDARSAEKKHGFLWFRDTTHFLQVQIIVFVYDTETGAKLLDESVMREIEVDALETAGAVKDVYRSEINAAVEEMLPDMGEKICDVFSDRPWHGFVISTGADRMTISTGEASGLKAGDELALFSGAKAIEGAGGRQFMIPGLKTGSIRITAVFPETSEAILVSGEAAKEGDVVRAE